MKSLRLVGKILAGVLMAMTFSAVAHAQATRTWVSGVGDDVNPCSRTAPCKTFAGAISKTAAGGEINCLDPGGFGALTITKAIKIDCTGTFGSVLAVGVSGIVINANAATDVITLRGLEIFGALPTSPSGQGINGIRYLSAKTVHLEKLHIIGFTSNCVDVETSNSAGQLTMDDVLMENCGGNAGLTVATTNTSVVQADLHNVRIYSSNFAVLGNNGTRMNIRDCVFALNAIGVNQNNLTGGGGSTINISGSTISFSTSDALRSVAGAFMAAFGNTFTSNGGTVFNANGGNIATGTDNTTFGNGGPGFANGGNVPKI